MYKRILLCYDGTAQGRNALRCGAELAIQLNAQVHVLAVQDMMMGALVPEAYSGATAITAQAHAEEILEEGVGWLRDRGLTAEGHLVFGRPGEHIPVVAKRLNIDLVVIGHRPQGMLSRWWMRGSTNAYEILDHLDCSIHVAMDQSPPLPENANRS
jgi:nucleotide-binding universal stress UspA family protein